MHLLVIAIRDDEDGEDFISRPVGGGGGALPPGGLKVLLARRQMLLIFYFLSIPITIESCVNVTTTAKI